MTPLAAGLGSMVNFDKGEFIGRAALEACDKRRRTQGLRVADDLARLGDGLSRNGETAGRVCSTAWAPFQRCGVAIVRRDDPDLGPGGVLDVECEDGVVRTAEICDLPMYDRERAIPRGALVDVPDLPEVGDPRQVPRLALPPREERRGKHDGFTLPFCTCFDGIRWPWAPVSADLRQREIVLRIWPYISTVKIAGHRYRFRQTCAGRRA